MYADIIYVLYVYIYMHTHSRRVSEEADPSSYASCLATPQTLPQAVQWHTFLVFLRPLGSHDITIKPKKVYTVFASCFSLQAPIVLQLQSSHKYVPFSQRSLNSPVPLTARTCRDRLVCHLWRRRQAPQQKLVTAFTPKVPKRIAIIRQKVRVGVLWRSR